MLCRVPRMVGRCTNTACPALPRPDEAVRAFKERVAFMKKKRAAAEGRSELERAAAVKAPLAVTIEEQIGGWGRARVVVWSHAGAGSRC